MKRQKDGVSANISSSTMRIKIFTFPWQQWLFKQATMLHYTFIGRLLVYLSFQSCDTCRRLPEPKHHSFLFKH